MKELKIRCENELVERIRIMAKSRGISMNQMAIRLLEVGYIKVCDEEINYGKTRK